MKIFGIDPGSDRTGYGCVESDGSRHRIIISGAINAAGASFPEKLLKIHTGLAVLLAECRPDCVAIENLFHSNNARSALKLGHARGVAMLAAVEAGLPVAEYTPAEIKRAVVGYGRAEKPTLDIVFERIHPQDKALAQQIVESASTRGSDFEHERRHAGQPDARRPCNV